MKRRRIVARFSAGPTWGEGPPQAQPGWDAHAAFVDEHFARETIVMGGPFTDNSGAMILFEGVDEDEVRRLLETDPFVRNGVFVIEDVRDWTINVDALT